jgi:FAD/FMN-containing dehydrogenase
MPGPLIRTDLARRSRYSQGGGIIRIVPAAVARPTTAAELDEVLAGAKARGLTVTPRGAGSAMDGSSVGPGLILDLTLYDDDHCLVNDEQRRAFAAPSISLARLNAEASRHGLRVAVDPSSAAWATLGGLVSTNASGPRTVRSGSVRRWINGVAMVTVDGYLDLSRNRESDQQHPVVARWRNDVEPLLRRHEGAIRAHFPAVRKNSAGYALNHYLDSEDLLDIVIGAEGTLGVITDVNVDLEPVPAHRAALRVAVRTRADLVPMIEAIRTSNPATLEFLDASFLRLIAPGVLTPEHPGLMTEAAGLLLADFESDDETELVDRGIVAARAVQGTALDVRFARDPIEIEKLWNIRHRASPILAGLTDGRRSLQVIEDGCVPVPRLAEYLDAVDSVARRQRIDVVMFGHAGDGHVHVNLLPNVLEPDWKDRVRAVFDDVSTAVLRLGGTPSGEHGAGRLRAGLLGPLYGPEIMECFRAVKQAFDPAGFFNPGVILGDGSDPFGALKIGADAPPLPDGIDGYLQRIEAQARWGESRWSV